MNADSQNDPAKLAAARLTDACRTRDRAARLRWTLAICEATVLAALVLALIDYWWMLSVAARSVGALLLAALALGGLARLIQLYRRPTGLKKGALEVEAQRPDLGCEISTAAEYLSGERRIIHEYEPELVAALETRAAQKLNTQPIDYRKKLRLYGAALAFSLLGLLALLVALPAMLTALHRTTIPLSRAHYTTVEVRPGDIEIPVGHNFEITNIFSGRLPKHPLLHWQPAESSQWQEVALTKPGAGTYTLMLSNISGDIYYRASGGDAVSQNYKITTYIPPAVKDLAVAISFPEYTGLPPVSQKSPDVTAVRASTLQLQLEPSVPLAGAKLRFSSLPELALAPGTHGTWTGNLQITKDAEYWIELTDKKGHRGANDKPFHIRALPDNPPKVEVAEPGQDIRSSNTNKVLVKLSVSDDFGVNEIKLVVNKLRGPQLVIPATRQAEHNGEITATAELDLSALGLNEYELVAYHAEATDNNTLDGPGVGKSPVYFVEITNEEGRPCLSQGRAQKVNLLVIQKQIIADSTALAPKARADEFNALAARQRDATEFGQMYLDALERGAAPEPAVKEMQAAIHDMNSAVTSLQAKNRSEALPPEEGALAHLYQVLKLLPELENLPTQPPMAGQQPPANPKLRVVLEAIKQRKKEESNNQEIQEALNQARELARSQSALNSEMRHPGNNNSNGSAEDATAPGSNRGDQREPNDASDHGASPRPDASAAPDAQQLAERENRLSEEAGHLAEMLQRLAGNNSRLGHNAGNNATRAASKMASAGKAMRQGQLGLAGEQGMEGEVALRGVIAQLERFLKNQPEPSDIAHEDYPKSYEALISEYLKKLSHAE